MTKKQKYDTVVQALREIAYIYRGKKRSKRLGPKSRLARNVLAEIGLWR